MGLMLKAYAEGKTRAELIKALRSAIRELGGAIEEVSTDTSVKLSLATTELDDEGMIEVESPYAAANPSSNSNLAVVQGEVDSEGIPWDKRIHSSSKKKVANGTWRLGRGVDENLAMQIKSEYRKNAPVQTQAPVQNFQNNPPVNQPVYNVPQTQAPVVTQTLPNPNPPQPQMNNGGHTFDTFKNNFAVIVAQLLTDKKIGQDYVNQLKSFFNITEIWMANDEQKFMCFTDFAKYGFIQQVG
jgi:hypothetical protein